MKTKIINFFKVGIFLSIGVVLFVLVSYMLRPVSQDRIRVAGYYALPENSIDIVCLGTSATYRYFNNPVMWENYGVTSYNFATGSQSPSVLKSLILECEKTQSPKLYIVETRKLVKYKELDQEVVLRKVTDCMKYSANRIDLINKEVPKFWERPDYYFDIIKYHDNWKNLSDSSFDYITNEYPDELNGWRNINKLEILKPFEEPYATTEEPMNEESEEILLDFMDFCKEQNINVLFVATPWRATKECQKRNNYLSRIIEENGFEFLDCTPLMDDIGLDFETDFFNNNHTNAIGAEKFTNYFGKYLTEKYDFSSEYSDEVIDSWEKIVELNRADMNAKYGTGESDESELIEDLEED